MKKRQVIFDTDWWTDCDDCVALKLLLCAEDVELKGVNINAFLEISPYSAELFIKNTCSKEIPIAVDKSATAYDDTPKHSYQEKIIESFSGGEYKSSGCYDDSVKFYRKLLSTAEEKIDIIAVGFQNSIARLIMSGGDEFSPLNGIELCREKVGKLWAMAGKWDKQGEKEYNVAKSELSVNSAKLVAEKFPCPVTYLGFEVGESVITGGKSVLSDENDPLFVSMVAHGSSQGRNSWDPMTALLAVYGDEKKAGYDTVSVKIAFDEMGKNYFEKDENSHRCFVVKRESDNFYKNEINKRIAVDKSSVK